MNIAILEDEYIHTYRLTENISTILKELNISTYELKTFKKSESLLNDLFVPSNQNIYFLDLELEGNEQQGLEISKLIRKYDNYASLIFFTSHSELLPLTYRYKVSALDFIAKDSQTLLDDIKEDLKIVLNKRKKLILTCLIYRLVLSSSILNSIRYVSLSHITQIATHHFCGYWTIVSYKFLKISTK